MHMTTTQTATWTSAHITVGNGTAVHYGAADEKGRAHTMCGSERGRLATGGVSRVQVTTAPVTCKTCLGDATAPAPAALPTTAPEACTTHPTGRHSGQAKTIKRGTYQGYSCGCRVWLAQ